MKKGTVLSWIAGFIVPICLLILWEVCASNGLIKIAVTSSPSRIGNALLQWIRKGILFKNIWISLRRALLGFIFGSMAGVIVGLLMGLFRKINVAMRVLVGILRPIPLIAWIPVLILMVGIGEDSKVIAISIGAFWPLFLNTFNGILNVDKKYLEVSEVLRKSSLEKVFSVILPGTVPFVFAGLKLASGNALMAVIMAEMFAASSGIGYMVNSARELSQPAKMFAGIFVIALLGWLLNLIVENIETHISK
ncbi:MAG: ABC transporter permease [Lachnospiraceae bacterium]